MSAAMDEGEQHISTTEARAGSTPHMTRYILVWGIGLVIVAFVVVVALSGDNSYIPERGRRPSRRAQFPPLTGACAALSDQPDRI